MRVIGREEWDKRLEEENRGTCMVLGLFGSREETECIVPYTKEFLSQCWQTRARRTRWTTSTLG